MGRVKEWAFDEAEDIIDQTIEKVINDELTFNKGVEQCQDDKMVNIFFTDNEIEMIFTHEIKKELNNGFVSEH